MKYFLILFTFVSCGIFAQSTNNLSIPQSTGIVQGTDSVRSSDGVNCSISVAPRDKWMEIGVLGQGYNGQGVENQYPSLYTGSGQIVYPPSNPYQRQGVGIYAKLVINLDKERPRLDCNELYRVELERLKLELEQLKLGVPKAELK